MNAMRHTQVEQQNRIRDFFRVVESFRKGCERKSRKYSG